MAGAAGRGIDAALPGPDGMVGIPLGIDGPVAGLAIGVEPVGALTEGVPKRGGGGGTGFCACGGGGGGGTG